VVFFFFVVFLSGVPEHSHAADSAAIGAVGFWVMIAVIFVAWLLASIVFIIMGTVAAGEGRPYSYPFAIRFLK
jgi:uncharacterized Tic20 family protein